MTFHDHFSPVAAAYAASRPRYPGELFDWLASLTHRHALAWDAGCGSGQASVALAAHYDQVIATDASAAQLANAERRPNVTYRIAAESDELIAEGSVDLVTVAQAVHWFDRTRFWREVQRALAPGGVLAVWAYGLARISPAIDAMVLPWYRDLLGPYWPPERDHVESQYRDIGFPYATLAAPAFAMTAQWDRRQFTDYLRTWSAVKEYRRLQRADALESLMPQLEAVWPGDDVRRVEWPLTILAGRRTAA
ncbi:MAG TPA: class I SAM-dependent methyltransferase [Gemmatimonadaceae bacterium]|nr:class I SAM-dependent methyltransferase [Gemmatimonadaceae bacterium]